MERSCASPSFAGHVVAELVKNPDARIIEVMRAVLRAAIARHVSDGAPVALLNYPNHSNVGDCAIWLGELSHLADTGHAIVYQCDLHSYDPDTLRRSLPRDGVVLLHGGGNLGDLWPAHQAFRERVVADLPDHPVVVMPQSIHFTASVAIERARAAFDRHERLTIIARDESSYSFAREAFNSSVDLAPDPAVWLDLRRARSAPSQAVVWLARTDLETSGALIHHETLDWVDVRRSDMGWYDWSSYRMLKRITGVLARSRRGPHTLRALQQRLFQPVASAHLGRGIRLLSSGEVVIADRLHAHLLCLLLGIPHVLLDNSYGKLGSFTRTWTSESTLAHWAQSPSEAFAIADRLTGS
jgi:exopolysaccharide biosynthesis predicted pyruvyltransferase EpsI